MKKNDKGITMLSLVVMLVVLMMLATITMYYGNSAMKEAKLQDLKYVANTSSSKGRFRKIPF